MTGSSPSLTDRGEGEAVFDILRPLNSLSFLIFLWVLKIPPPVDRNLMSASRLRDGKNQKKMAKKAETLGFRR
jgi:hypothetical protein